jgi:hypothetical protein
MCPYRTDDGGSSVRLPSALIICGQRFHVEEIDDPTEALGRHGSDDPIGQTDTNRGRIRIRGGSEHGPDQQRDTMLHEIIHVVLLLSDMHDIPCTFKNDRERERAVSVLATYLLDTLRRNPKLVAYLTGE